MLPSLCAKQTSAAAAAAVWGVLNRRPLHPVLEEVRVEGGFLCGAVGAEHAGIRLLPGVGADVCFEDALMRGLVGAVRAVEWALPRVGVHVLLQQGLAGGLVGAVRAHERLFPRVFINVSLQGLYAGGGVGTMGTLVHLGGSRWVLPAP